MSVALLEAMLEHLKHKGATAVFLAVHVGVRGSARRGQVEGRQGRCMEEVLHSPGRARGGLPSLECQGGCKGGMGAEVK